MNGLEDYLLQSEGKNKEELPSDNPFRGIAFDHGKKRMGWVRNIPFSLIKNQIKSMDDILNGKDNFIFVGMGGSINGIKALRSVVPASSSYILDSLDPLAINDIVKDIESLDKTLVISISKSGTTKETHYIASALKELFKDGWRNHFLWLAIPLHFLK